MTKGVFHYENNAIIISYAEKYMSSKCKKASMNKTMSD